MLVKELTGPSGVVGWQGWSKGEAVVEQMVAAAFMALINKGLQVQEHVGIGWAQGNTDDWQSVTQPARIHRQFFGTRWVLRRHRQDTIMVARRQQGAQAGSPYSGPPGSVWYLVILPFPIRRLSK